MQTRHRHCRLPAMAKEEWSITQRLVITIETWGLHALTSRRSPSLHSLDTSSLTLAPPSLIETWGLQASTSRRSPSLHRHRSRPWSCRPRHFVDHLRSTVPDRDLGLAGLD
eukprot:3198481-Rhodomonas_salina.1